MPWSRRWRRRGAPSNGSSGTASYLVRGLGNAESLHSSSHGAGRWFSRTEAKRRHDEQAFLKHMAARDILHFGLEPDETFQAYKDIEMVIAVQEGILVEVIARMKPKVVLMGGKSASVSAKPSSFSSPLWRARACTPLRW